MNLVPRFVPGVAALILSAATAHADPRLRAEGSSFVLTTDGGRVLRSADLVGAILDVTDEYGQPARIRIDAVQPHPEMPAVLLHDFRVEVSPGDWQPMCDADRAGVRMGLPVAGAWDPGGRFIADPAQFFVTCTSGSNAKCILFGYDPWKTGPHGESLVPYYEACQNMVRAAYAGTTPFTTNGTTIDLYDDLGIQTPASLGDPDFAFEAGWTAEGAACVQHPRHPEVISAEALSVAYPSLVVGDACTEEAARAAGAHLFNRSRPVPTDGF